MGKKTTFTQADCGGCPAKWKRATNPGIDSAQPRNIESNLFTIMFNNVKLFTKLDISRLTQIRFSFFGILISSRILRPPQPNSCSCCNLWHSTNHCYLNLRCIIHVCMMHVLCSLGCLRNSSSLWLLKFWFKIKIDQSSSLPLLFQTVWFPDVEIRNLQSFETHHILSKVPMIGTILKKKRHQRIMLHRGYHRLPPDGSLWKLIITDVSQCFPTNLQQFPLSCKDIFWKENS